MEEASPSAVMCGGPAWFSPAGTDIDETKAPGTAVPADFGRFAGAGPFAWNFGFLFLQYTAPFPNLELFPNERDPDGSLSSFFQKKGYAPSPPFCFLNPPSPTLEQTLFLRHILRSQAQLFQLSIERGDVQAHFSCGLTDISATGGHNR